MLGLRTCPCSHFVYTIARAPFFLLLLYFWLHHTACGILAPQPEIEPTDPAAEAQSLNCQTAREVPHFHSFSSWSEHFFPSQALFLLHHYENTYLPQSSAITSYAGRRQCPLTSEWITKYQRVRVLKLSDLCFHEEELFFCTHAPVRD